MTLDEARRELADAIQPNGDLKTYDDYLEFVRRHTYATLDGCFSADRLEAIAVYMRAMATPAPQ